MSFGAPQQEGAPVERPRVVEKPPAPVRGPARMMWIAVIVALLVGAGGGYGLRWGLGPSKTVTKTVTHTVAPPAYTVGTSVTTQVNFDGKTCAYSGPSEFKDEASVTFNYATTAAVPSTLFALRLAAGTTYEGVVSALPTHGTDNPPSFVEGFENSEPLSAKQQSLTKALRTGVYALVCATSPESTNKVFFGTMLRVVAG